MKENVLDVLMYLFESYMDEEAEISPDEESLKTELLEAGFPQAEINKALAWLEGLAALQDDHAERHNSGVRPSFRVFTEQETGKLGMDGRGFLLFLEQVGVLDAVSRELVIDRVMALETDEINLEELKWVVLMVLFNQPGQENALARMKVLVMDEVTQELH